MTNELLPFNLEEALKNPERVVYRNGEKPLEWHWFEKANQDDYCLISVSNDLNFESHFINGFAFANNNVNQYDLIIKY